MNLARLEQMVRDRIGLDPVSLGAAALPRAAAARMAAHGLTGAESYAAFAAGNDDEWSALVGELVVPETWFFRGGRDFFEHLARWLGNQLRETPERIVRVLSVPCCTGEEPYSLAIALDRLGIPAARCRIDGIDLAGEHLRRAAAGRFPAFSFRDNGADPRPAYFHATEDGKWELRPELRSRVQFQIGNVVDPNFRDGEAPYDLILCRNLFIYLTADGCTRAVANLERLLAANGRLCVAPGEADRLPSSRFVPDGPAAWAIFQRGAKPKVAALPAVRPSKPSRPLPVRGTAAVPAETPPPARLPAAPLERGRELADAGHLDAAREICENALGAEAPTAELFTLLGAIHLAAGQMGEAGAAFRKALYLDPDHTEALLHMAVLCEQRGDSGQAAGLRRRIDRLAKGAAP